MMNAAEIRQFEHDLQDQMEAVFCPTHLSLGHEHVAVEIAQALMPDDWLYSTHRNHHHYLAKGGNQAALWLEIMGSPHGINGGFSGSQGISDAALHFHASAIVGGLVGVATGTAYALRDTGKVVVCVIGDAGTEQGVFWESLNFAVLHSLPIAYIVENNGKSVDAELHERQATPIKPRVQAFGVIVCDTVGRAIRTARLGLPSFHEAMVTLECDHLNMSTLLPSLGLK